jgi:WD40 domain-containing protein
MDYGKGETSLWRDPELQIALNWRERIQPNAPWAQRYHPAFEQAMRFLDESREAREGEALAREAEARAKEQQRRRELTRTRIFASLVTIAAGYAYWWANEAEEQKKEAEEQKKTARQLNYMANVNLAQSAFVAGNFRSGGEALNAFLPTSTTRTANDMHGFEWYYLWRQYHQEFATLQGHTHDVSSVAFAPDGKTLATGSGDRTVRLWFAATDAEVAAQRGN